MGARLGQCEDLFGAVQGEHAAGEVNGRRVNAMLSAKAACRQRPTKRPLGIR